MADIVLGLSMSVIVCPIQNAQMISYPELSLREYSYNFIGYRTRQCIFVPIPASSISHCNVDVRNLIQYFIQISCSLSLDMSVSQIHMKSRVNFSPC